MRRLILVLTVALVVGLIGQEAFSQARGGGQTGFEVGGSTGGQGSSGNFGVGTAGQVDNNARFMRDNRQGAFVGADSGDSSSFVGAVAAGAGGQANRNIRRGGGGQANVNQGAGRGRQKNEVRVVLRLGFKPTAPASIAPTRTPAAVAARLAGRMERSSWIQNRSPLEVSIDQGTATLRGVVATEHDRVLAERLVLLEGGIWKVANELQIQAAAPDSQEAPALLNLSPDPVSE
jgi:osmotically-inducible protein OsmY